MVFYLTLSQAYSKEVDLITAKCVAWNYYFAASSHSDAGTIKGSDSQMELKLVRQDPGNMHIPPYYAFNINDNHGFIIVSGTDLVKPILAYAFEGTYEESCMSPAFCSWMESIKNQIQFAIINEIKPLNRVTKEWDRYKKGIQTPGTEKFEKVNPLLSSRWGERCYYNLFCPADTSCVCIRAPAGCAAVAMAQIMRYWEYPELSNEIPGYDTNYGWMPGAKPTAYLWPEMPNSLNASSTQLEIEEIARLIYHCGMSLKTNYSPKMSISYSRDITHAFTAGFNYDSSIQIVYRVIYPGNAWEEMLKKELDSGRPVLYVASGPNKGHGFICDGYDDSGYFHFNWGWNGVHNGYYYVGELTPGTNNFN